VLWNAKHNENKNMIKSGRGRTPAGTPGTIQLTAQSLKLIHTVMLLDNRLEDCYHCWLAYCRGMWRADRYIGLVYTALYKTAYLQVWTQVHTSHLQNDHVYGHITKYTFTADIKRTAWINCNSSRVRQQTSHYEAWLFKVLLIITTDINDYM